METNVKIKKKIVRIVITVVFILLLKSLFTLSASFQHFYFHRWYVWISIVLRQVLGKIPFSIGDVIYAGWIITGIIYLLKLCYNLVRMRWQEAFYVILKAINAVLGIYVAFLLLWGYNYERNSLAKDMHLEVKPYTTAQLYQLADTLLILVNKEKANLGDTMAVMQAQADSALVFTQAIQAYGLAAKQWPTLNYEAPAVKKAIFGKWLNYVGVTGYLNPFTGEAQVNTTTPYLLHPFVTCHEIAHQLGYAPEEEANFVGYLAATQLSDSRFRYAANFEMFLYTVGHLSRQDSTLTKEIWSRTVPGVKADYKAIGEFYRQYKGPVDNYSQLLYDQYLKANNQEKGIHSYSEVVGWLVAYFKL
jgi:hypothetical protein